MSKVAGLRSHSASHVGIWMLPARATRQLSEQAKGLIHAGLALTHTRAVDFLAAPPSASSPPGTFIVACGGMRFVVETRLCSLSALLSSVAIGDGAAVHVSMDASYFQLGLRLMRDLALEPAQRRNRAFVEKCLHVAREFGLPDALVQDLSHLLASLTSIIMPEIAAALETNPRRKILLYKQVVYKARLLDLTSGGARAVQAKIARLKVVEALVKSAQTSDVEQTKEMYAHYCARLVVEGQNTDLPPPVQSLLDALRKQVDELCALVGPKPKQVPPPVFATVYLPREPLVQSSSLGENMVLVDVGGRITLELHVNELREIPILFKLLPVPPNMALFVGDDPDRFQLTLHVIRTRGRLEALEKADIGVLSSYRAVSRRYGLAPDLSQRIEAWIRAHKHGIGGATNAQEEIRGLKLTRVLNPERGDALVSSALAEAYLEAADKTLEAGKKLRMVGKAETALKTVLPIMITSASVVKGDVERKKAVTQMVDMLKKCLALQGREAEADMLDAAVGEFQRGIAGSIDDLARVNAAARQPTDGMYS